MKNGFYSAGMYKLLVGAIVFLLIITIILSIQNRSLKSEIESLRSKNEIPVLLTGDTVRSLRFTDLQNQFQEINFTEEKRKHLLFIFTTTCPYCDKNFINWLDILYTFDLPSCKMIFLSLDDEDKTKDYVVRNGFDFTVGIVDSMSKSILKLFSVPQTILIYSNNKRRFV